MDVIRAVAIITKRRVYCCGIVVKVFLCLKCAPLLQERNTHTHIHTANQQILLSIIDPPPVFYISILLLLVVLFRYNIAWGDPRIMT